MADRTERVGSVHRQQSVRRAFHQHLRQRGSDPQDGSGLAMSGTAADDDADTSRDPRALVRYVPRYGKPHADAGAISLGLPRPNDG